MEKKIHCLHQDNTAHPGLLAGRPPAGLLSASEMSRFQEIKSANRRRDWLLGRWTAKHLIQRVLNVDTPLRDIQISNDERGAPVAAIRNQPGRSLSLSISHSGGHAFCGLVEKPDFPLGADIERVQPQTKNFAADFFTRAEMALVENCAVETRDTLVNAIWSAKESTLKALGVGFMLDPSVVSCLIKPFDRPPARWTAFQVVWESEELKKDAPQLCGWWRAKKGFVFSLAAGDEGEKIQIRELINSHHLDVIP